MNLDSSGASREYYYYKVSDAEDLGTYLIVCENSPSAAKVFHPVPSGSDRYRGESVDAPITEKGILSTAAVDACQVVLEKVDGTDSDYYIRVTSNGWWGSTTYYLSYNNGTFNSSGSPTVLALYKPDDGGLKGQYLHFSEDTFPFNITGLDLPVENIPGVPVLTGNPERRSRKRPSIT